MDLFTLGTKLYDCRRKINYRCVLVFMVCSMMHHGESKALQEFLQQTEMRKRFFAAHPQVFAQLTRQFFFRNSRAAERLTAIMQTFQVMERSFSDKALEYLYLDEQKPLHLWEMPYGEEHTLSLEMFFRNGEIREGSMTLALCLDGEFVYHINFWCRRREKSKFFILAAIKVPSMVWKSTKSLRRLFLATVQRTLFCMLCVFWRKNWRWMNSGLCRIMVFMRITISAKIASCWFPMISSGRNAAGRLWQINVSLHCRSLNRVRRWRRFRRESGQSIVNALLFWMRWRKICRRRCKRIFGNFSILPAFMKNSLTRSLDRRILYT